MVVVDVVVWAKATATSSKRASTSRIVRRREKARQADKETIRRQPAEARYELWVQEMYAIERLGGHGLKSQSNHKLITFLSCWFLSLDTADT